MLIGLYELRYSYTTEATRTFTMSTEQCFKILENNIVMYTFKYFSDIMECDLYNNFIVGKFINSSTTKKYTERKKKRKFWIS